MTAGRSLEHRGAGCISWKTLIFHSFFVKKEPKKLLSVFGGQPSQRGPAKKRIKSFCFFFFRKRRIKSPERRAAALAGCALLLALSATPVYAQDFAIVHARAWTMTGDQPIDDATIVVQDGKIASVQPHAAAPAGMTLVDAHGATLTPGLMNGATQLGLVEIDAAADTDDRSDTGPAGAAFDVRYALNANSVSIPVARADGVTRGWVFPDRAGTVPFAGIGATICLDDKLLDTPDAAMVVTIGDGTQAHAGGSRAAQWLLLRNALAEARAFAAAPPSLAPRDQLLDHLDVAALGKLLSGAMPLAIVTDRESDIRQAIRLADDAHIRVVIVGGAEAWRVAPELAAAHIPVVLDPLANLPVDFDQLGARLDNAALLDRAGVVIAFTVSGNTLYRTHEAGLALREGAGIAIANGLPYVRAMRAVTLGAAQIWGVDGHYGALTPGADADLVLWDGDPLDVTSAPTHVYVKGREASLVTRQTLLRDRYAPARVADPLPPAYR